LLTKPVDQEKLIQYYKKLKPNGWWKPIAILAPEVTPDATTSKNWLGFLSGVLFLNSILFAVGHLVLGRYLWAFGLFSISALCAWLTLHYVEEVAED
jgi:SSS family solute:Na+ symporter